MSTPESTPTPYTRVDLNPMPESTLSPQSGTLDLASVLYDIGKGHTVHIEARTSFANIYKKNKNSSIINREKIVNDTILKVKNPPFNQEILKAMLYVVQKCFI